MSETTHPMLLIRNVPAPVTVTVGPAAAKALEAAKASWTVTRVDRLAGGRTNTIRVNVANPKKPGSAAHRNYGLYDGATVETFLKAYPAADGGLGRARASLAWDLNYGYVSVVNAAGDVLTA